MATWTCPFCNQNATLTSSNITTDTTIFEDGNKYGTQVIRVETNTCPNVDCQEFTLRVSLHDSGTTYGSYIVQPKKSWQLIPASKAKPFPSYIPKAVLDDYVEACIIRDLSPKASATLSRRCLQGIIRDFWGVKKARLIDEIEAIKDKVDPLTWQAIDAVRHIGNIGAHMEKDINLIIDVEPQEAGLLIGLIEMLLKEWYIVRYERQEQLKAIAKLADAKKQAKARPNSP
ncbi:MAG TPA: DUF4145 domain-containing protein [Pyrinomonadaceae bacterium]|jgi:hypothetical protein